MNYRYTAALATVANSFCDAVLDYTVNKFNYYKVLFFTSLIAFFIQLAWGGHLGISVTLAALPYVIMHAALVLLGYISFVKALKYLPLGLIGLLETGNLFITLIIDSLIGYITITPYFLVMFVIFISSIALFSRDCLKQEKHCLKSLKIQGYLWAFSSVIFYVSAPYLVKISSARGADEFAINLGYYAIAIPYFAVQFFRTRRSAANVVPTQWWNNLLFLSFVIGVLESLYYVMETFSFINDAPTVVMIIEQMRIFLVFGLSVLFKMDTFTLPKTIALILGAVSVVAVYFT